MLPTKSKLYVIIHVQNMFFSVPVCNFTTVNTRLNNGQYKDHFSIYLNTFETCLCLFPQTENNIFLLGFDNNLP